MALSRAEKKKRYYMGRALSCAEKNDYKGAEKNVEKAAEYDDVTAHDVKPVNKLLGLSEKIERARKSASRARSMGAAPRRRRRTGK